MKLEPNSFKLISWPFQVGYSLLTKAPLIYDWEFKYFIGFKTENSQQAVITQSFYCKKYYYLHISEQIKVELTST